MQLVNNALLQRSYRKQNRKTTKRFGVAIFLGNYEMAGSAPFSYFTQLLTKFRTDFFEKNYVQ